MSTLVRESFCVRSGCLGSKGISEDEAWSEESFFIENISLDKANEYAAKYGQLAFVYGIKSEKAQLVYTIF